LKKGEEVEYDDDDEEEDIYVSRMWKTMSCMSRFSTKQIIKINTTFQSFKNHGC
jgi:hypothetical protein